uniref:Uncharacterized protein n=1 Tax=Peltaster fructicola TaxID=286661 RepID=A0A6H0XW56_9PEZI|nr:hypothetical protein AMS68_004519 [Peltaster fructicola]
MPLPEELLERIFFELRIQIPTHAERTDEQVLADKIKLQTLAHASRASRPTHRTARKALWHTLDFPTKDREWLGTPRESRVRQVLRTLSRQPDTASLVRHIYASCMSPRRPLCSRDMTVEESDPTAILLATEQEWLPDALQVPIAVGLIRNDSDAEFASLICMCKRVTIVVFNMPYAYEPSLTLSVCRYARVPLSSTEAAGQPPDSLTTLQQLRHLGLTLGCADRHRPRMALPSLDILQMLGALLRPPALSFRATMLEVRHPLPFSSRMKEIFLIDTTIYEDALRDLLVLCRELKTLCIQGHLISSRRVGMDIDWAAIGQCLKNHAANLETLSIAGDGSRGWFWSHAPGFIGSLAELTSLHELLLPLDTIFDTHWYTRNALAWDNLVDPLVDILPVSLESLTLHRAGDISDRLESRLDAQLLQLMEEPRFKKLRRIVVNRNQPIPAWAIPAPWVASYGGHQLVRHMVNKLDSQPTCIDED